MPAWSRIVAALFVLLPAAGGCGTGAEPTSAQLLVFAAASLRDVAAEIAAEFGARSGAEVVHNFAGSNTLAQQIDAARGADVFISADRRWAEFLEARGRTEPGSRRAIFSNRLVLIAHRRAALTLEDPRELAHAPYRYLALADPEGVPAGRYARARLERLAGPDGSLWAAVEGRLAPALDVRAALALVESDPEIHGNVYRTDALTSEKVRILHEFEPLPEEPMSYWAALVAGGPNPELARSYLEFLESPEARSIAERHGFLVTAG